MALTRATDKIIANADGNLNLSGIVTASSFVGNVTGAIVPSGDVNVGSNIKIGAASGIVTATSFSGDGSNLTSLPAGLGTALSSTQTSPLNKLYYTNEILSIGATVTVDHPATGTGAYTQYADIRLEEGADLIIEDGDDVIPDILGLGTDGGGLGAGGSGRIRVDSITNKNANGAPNFPNGLTGTAGTFTGNLNVGGVLTYEDVTNVDSVGVVTARLGINLVGNDLNVGSNIKIGNTSGIVTATSFSGSGANLTGINTAFGSGTSVNTSGIITATAFVPSQGQLSHRNIIINGAMSVAQRGTSSSSDGYHTVDRFKFGYGGENEAPVQYQGVLASSDTGPYGEGFRYAFYVVNGNQTGGAGTGDYAEMQYKVEAQDMATSGWNYTSSSSFITLSFWVKSSVAQNFYGFVYSADGTAQRYIFETGTLTANQWKKVVVVAPGGTNVQFDNNVNEGFIIKWIPFYGTAKTNNSGTTLGAWANYNGGARTPDYTSTWWTTDNSTFWITGVQLEVGPVSTPFEHRSFADELRRCQRYYWKIAQNKYRRVNGYKRGDSNCHWELHCPVPMRTAPTPTLLAGGTFTNFNSNFNTTQSSPTVGEWNTDTGQGLLVVNSNWSSNSVSIPSWEGYSIEFSAEL